MNEGEVTATQKIFTEERAQEKVSLAKKVFDSLRNRHTCIT